MALRDKEDDSLLLSRSGRMSFKDRGGEHCVAMRMRMRLGR